MTSFDNPGLFYQERFFASDGLPDEGREVIAEFKKVTGQFRRFIREYSTGGFSMIYREQLKKNYNRGEYRLEISLNDLKNFDEEAAIKLRKCPSRFMPALEEAAKQVVDEITQPRPEGEEEVHDIQVTITLDEYATSIRKIKSSEVSQIVKVSGIVVAASQVRAKATHVSIQCRTCRHTVNDIELKPGLEGFALPRKCGANQTTQLQRCPMDPYHIMPDKCRCVDYQTLKLQENPEDVPHGEMPRHVQLYCDRYLTDRVAPGNRVTVIGVFSIRTVVPRQKVADKSLLGIRAPYIRVLGIHIKVSGPGRADEVSLTPEEERKFRELSKKPNAYEIIASSIAPSIYGSDDIKKAIACLLFGGSRKRLPDGLTRRGDINVLLLGDPGTAKSQLLKFVEKVAPIGIYTSGKGSSAAGLTASVIRDPQSRSFIMEGGAMVLADGGVVCIDEFDKMREDDRVAIHEAMEQQTISIAKAGITTTLNSRCAVLAAANSVYGRWDEQKGGENIDFMPTILSRFDMIFIVKDTHDVTRDTTLAKHVIAVHVNASSSHAQEQMIAEGELSLEFLKKYISYCRITCAPRLSEAASEVLVHNYVRLRNPPTDNEQKQGRSHRSAIPITVRQLEAVVRMSEALAKMELQPFAGEKHVSEALRLFRVSTIEATATGNLSGIEGFTSPADQEAFNRIERQLKKRFALGTHVSEYLIVQDFVSQNYPESMVKKVIQMCIRRGELQYRMQRKMLYRVH
ncbi:DNA replication licensing factor mcm-5 [Toxocara canis]|uniref:DNA replication licensing factor MCM5 n=1 Tax=Toxocara canis TaxID=6265 RepID=A0A0B2UT61_TOXCA|nr:DNA replication licensing factor mcm-5 [Toxocara canis]